MTLIKSVLSPANIYQLSCIRSPGYICSKIDSRCTDFFWGSVGDRKRMHLLKRDKLFLPVRQGGLGLRSTDRVNIAPC